MMIIHGPSLGILPIVLTIILTTPSIHCSYGNLRTLIDDGEMVEPLNAGIEREVVMKIPINLDLSGDAPPEISVLQGSIAPACNIYVVERHHHHTHKIGAILDGNIMVLRNNNRSVYRRVQFCIEEDGTRVLKIADLLETEDGLQREITEMVKHPGMPFYEPLIMLPVNIDLLEECPHQINAHINEETQTVRYAIRPEFRYRTIIGVVRYGGLVVDDRLNENVLKREVTLRPDGGNPQILVTSHMKDGSKVNARYLFGKGRNGGVIVPMRRVFRPQ